MLKSQIQEKIEEGHRARKGLLVYHLIHLLWNTRDIEEVHLLSGTTVFVHIKSISKNQTIKLTPINQAKATFVLYDNRPS